MRIVLLAIALLGIGAMPARANNCDPWPGEPRPLPALDDPDAVRAEWASLRVKELAQWARRAEKNDPLRARQMWRQRRAAGTGVNHETKRAFAVDLDVGHHAANAIEARRRGKQRFGIDRCA